MPEPHQLDGVRTLQAVLRVIGGLLMALFTALALAVMLDLTWVIDESSGFIGGAGAWSDQEGHEYLLIMAITYIAGARDQPPAAGQLAARRGPGAMSSRAMFCSAGCSTSARIRFAMNRAVRTGVPPRVTSETVTTPRPVSISTRRPLRDATTS